MGGTFTVELRCGQEGVNLDEACASREVAEGIAERFGIRSRFEESVQDGVEYLDSYLYPTENNVEAVLDALDREGLSYDNIDVPRQLECSAIHCRLLRRFKRRVGVHVNVKG